MDEPDCLAVQHGNGDSDGDGDGDTQHGDDERRRAVLKGPPALPFSSRASASDSRLATLLDWATLAGAMITALLMLQADGLADAAARVQLVQLAGLAAACGAMLVWRRVALHDASPARRRAYRKYYELPSMLLRICWLNVNGVAMSAAPAGLLAGRLFAIGSLPVDSRWLVVRLAALAAHVLHLLISSSAVVMIGQALRPMRLSLSILAQSVLASHRLHFAPVVCAAGPLAAPVAQALTGRIYNHLSLLAYLAPLPMGAADVELRAEGECASVLRFMQLMLGALAPLGVQAVREARLWAAHSRQRRRAGRQRERGLSACLYAGVLWVSEDPVVRPFLYMFGVMLSGICWSAVVLATAAGGGGVS